jgi:hypothetical protein
MQTHQEQPGDSLETHATEIHDAGLGIKDASEPIVEALNKETLHFWVLVNQLFLG